jgi:hypothetical protein
MGGTTTSVSTVWRTGGGDLKKRGAGKAEGV